MKINKAFIIATSLMLVAFTGMSVNYDVTRDVIGSGAQAAISSSYAFNATVGQPNVGTGSSADYDICHGFWCDLVIPPTGPTIVPIGPAILIYRFTFDHIGIASLALLLLVLFLARQTYNRTRQTWGAA